MLLAYLELPGNYTILGLKNNFWYYIGIKINLKATHE